MPDIFTPGAVPINGVARALSKAAAFTIDIPQGARVRAIHVRNKTANAVTGGVKVGTTLGGTDVVAAGAVAASFVGTFLPLISAVNTAAVRTLYFDAVTAFNSAVLDIAVEWEDLV
jgi:hypothetical protein